MIVCDVERKNDETCNELILNTEVGGSQDVFPSNDLLT